MIVLGIETSCDETAAALVREDREILANRVLSQTDAHALYGGVVPEIAARAHIDHLDALIARTLRDAGLGIDAVGAVAATCGPGLIGGVMVGATMGKAIAAARGVPFVAINHLAAHALTVRLNQPVPFPYLLLLISGGHCQLLIAEGVTQFRWLGGTIDDAAGEAFDKTAKLLGLAQPGGPAIERAARTGDAARFSLPRPLVGRPGCDFSFSGLKTAVRRAAASFDPARDAQAVADLAAAFQAAVGDVLADRVGHALDATPFPAGVAPRLVVAGGVAANTALRACLAALCRERGVALTAPPASLCTDNAAMVAWAGIERLAIGGGDGLDFAPRPRWPLAPRPPREA